MKDHLKSFRQHVPPPIQHIFKPAFAGAGVSMLITIFAETMKQVGVQTPPMPSQPNQPGQQSSGDQNEQRSSRVLDGR